MCDSALYRKVVDAHREAHDVQVRLSCDNQLLDATLHLGRVQAFKEVLDFLGISTEEGYIKLLDQQEIYGNRQRERAEAAETELHRIRDEMRQDGVDRLEDEEQHLETLKDNGQAAFSIRTARWWIDQAERELTGVNPDDVTRDIQ